MTMIMIDKAVVEQALAALVRSEVMHGQPNFDIQDKLREALAQPVTLNGNNIFQDTEGTIPVTAVSQQVGFVAQQLILPSSDGIFLEVPQAQQPVQEPVAWLQLEAAVKELTDTLEDLADYAGAFSVSGVYLVEDKHARALLAQACKLLLKYDN